MPGCRCDSCGKNFKNPFDLISHESKNCKNKTCKVCGSIFNKVRDQNSKKKINCHCCNRIFCNIDHHQKHLRQVWKKIEGDLTEYDQPIFPMTSYEHYDGYIDLLKKNILILKLNQLHQASKKHIIMICKSIC